MNELQTDITNSPDAPQLITKSLNSLKLLKINIQIGGALLVELVRVSLINRLERVVSTPVYWLHVDIRLLINEAENLYLCSVLFVEGGRHHPPTYLTENCVYTQRRRAQTSTGPLL